MTRTLCQVDELRRLLARSDYAVFDCRFVLGSPGAGADAYLEAHIPGAVYVHLEDDMSGSGAPFRGRHPVPTPTELTALFSRLGIDAGTSVIVYDDSYGMVAARLWWMLRYMGHDAVTVLDGGWQSWVAAGLPCRSGVEQRRWTPFTGSPRTERLVAGLEAAQAPCLIDAREAVRYRGEQEPIDPVAGHIPGAVNHCWRDNLAADGRFLPGAAIRERLIYATRTQPDSATTHYCGSGVSACHNVLAQVLAGYPEPRLYGGSWSEWCRDAGRQVMMGAQSGR